MFKHPNKILNPSLKPRSNKQQFTKLHQTLFSDKAEYVLPPLFDLTVVVLCLLQVSSYSRINSMICQVMICQCKFTISVWPYARNDSVLRLLPDSDLSENEVFAERVLMDQAVGLCHLKLETQYFENLRF